jgi:hypothetical protein
MEIKNTDEFLKAVDTKTAAALAPIEAKLTEQATATDGVKADLIKVSADLVKANEDKDAIEVKFQELEQKQAENLTRQPTKAKTMAEELGENTDALRSLSKRQGDSTAISIKADTLRTSVTNNENALDLNGIGQLAHAKLTAYDIFNKLPVSDSNTNGTIRYYDWNVATTVRAAAAIAEGAVFPESTATWVKKTLDIEKIGDTLPVSEEFFEDSEMFAAELGMFLETNVKIKRNADLINGDGISPNIKGIVTTVGAFTAVASGISDANIYDLLVKVSEDITGTGGAKYAPNFALMNIVDINKMKLKKDANENYMIPPFVSRDGSQVAGMLVLEENAIVANTMVVGDSRYARIYERKGIEMSRGMVNAQFVEDMETLKVRTRLAFLIRDADVGGFRKVASISADLATLAT